MIFVSGPIAASEEPPYSFAALFIMLIERLVNIWNNNVGIPIFKISDMVSFGTAALFDMKTENTFFTQDIAHIDDCGN